MRPWLLVVASWSLVGLAAPRVVVQPLSASIPLPGAANAALLSTAASQAIELPSSFEVEDALAALPSKTCAADTACLAGLARATKSGWALAVAFEQRQDKALLSALVVAADGALIRNLEPLELPAIPATDEAWSAAFAGLMKRLELGSLGTSTPLAPQVKLTPSPPPLPPAQPPVQVERVAAAPSARTPVAVVAGLIAMGAGSAAAALAVTNLQEANALRSAAQAGLIPAASVDRAVAIDERTVVAAALGVGAGVAAGVAIGALLMKDAPVRLAPVGGAGGGGLTLSGRFP